MDGKTAKYFAAVSTGLIIFLLTGLMRGLFDTTAGLTAAETFGALSDACVTPGVLLAGAGGLSWIASLGTFDMLGYGASSFFGTWLPFVDPGRPKGEQFFDYKQRKAGKRQGFAKHWLITGLGFLAAGALFLVLYFIFS